MTVTAVDFLRGLWGDVPPGLMQLWTPEHKRSFYLTRAEEAAGFVGKADVYTRVSTVRRGLKSTERGDADASTAIAGVWGDLDLAAPDKPHGPPDLDAALELAHTLATPTIVVFSGGGIHPYYLLEEPWVFNGDRDAAAALAKAWGRLFTATAKEAGYGIDPVFDLPRLLRLPGTLNAKRGDPVPVEVIENEGTRYDRGELAELCRDYREPEHKAVPPVAVPTNAIADDHELLAKAFEAKNGAKIQALYDGDTSGYPSRSEADLALADHLAFWTGPDPERIERLMRGSKLVRDKWNSHKTYLRDTIDKALDGQTEFWGGAKRELSDLTVEDILKAGGVDPEDAEGVESPKDLLSLLKASKKTADRVVELVKEAGVELFHSENRTAYAMYEVDGHVETHRVGSKEFALYLRRLYHRSEETVLPSQSRKDAEGTLEAIAVFDGEMLPVHLRIAGDAGTIYIDLGDEEWRCIRITPEGWDVLHRHPVRFRRTAGMEALPLPERGGTLDALLDLLNLEEGDADGRLVIGCLLDAARPNTPYAICELVGEEGTAKSTAARALRAMIDPSSTPLRRMPSKSDDLFVSAYASHFAVFDNVSNLPDWLSDDLCRLATGGGQSKRELFTDEGEHLIDVRRPVIVNGIEEVATRGDLLRRSVRIELPVIPEEERLTEAEFWAAFDAVHPRLLGALCDALSCALARVHEVELERLPSMADFAQWVTAAEPALRWEPGSFMKAYEGRRNEAHEVVIESELAGPYIRQKCEQGFEGIPTVLLEELDRLVDGNTRKRTEWPKSPRKLTGVIKRLAPALRKLGYTVHRGKHTELGTPWVLGKGGRG